MPPLNPFSKTCVALAISQALALPAQAATITVDSHLDNGTNCTLREAVVSINAASLQTGCANTGAAFGTDDTVDFDLAGYQTISLTGGQLSIASGKNLTIIGAGETINGGGANRVFSLNNSTLSLNDLTLTGGSAVLGGGIFAVGSVVSLTNTTVSGNLTNYGGGIYTNSSSVSLTNSTVSDNVAGGLGGGIYATGSSVVSLTNSTVSGNSASGYFGAGGIWANGGNISLTNSTVSGNSAVYRAAGILAFATSFSLRNSLIAGNVAPIAAEIEDFNGGSTFTTAYNLFGDSSRTNAQAFSNFTPGASDINATSDGDVFSTHTPTVVLSIVSPLADNGGLTQTHALPTGSPALDMADGTVCTTAPVNSRDQRGVARTAVCDIGAFEYQATATITVNSADDTTGGVDCTLRDAILSANNNTPTGGCAAGADGSEQIVFDGGVGTTITLSSRSPTINSDLTIDGAGRTIDAALTGRVLRINDATVTLSQLTLTGGITPGSGAGFYSSRSNVTLSDSTVSGNSATNRGGGIIARSGSLTLINSTVSGNTASGPSGGGGIYAFDYSSVSLTNSTVSGNSAVSNGGGIYATNYSTLSLSNSTVSGNSANKGGGIMTSNSSVSLTSSTVSGNSANFGGGIFAAASSFSLSNSLIAGNLSPNVAEIENFFGTSTYNTAGGNLFGDSSHTSGEAFYSFTPGDSDINATSGTDGGGMRIETPLLSIVSPLADNGGPTQTHALPAGSPALDVADGTLCATAPVNSLDQRGLPRDSACDIGAVERQPTLTINVDSAADTTGGASCTLRDAILSSNNNTENGGCSAGGFYEQILFDAAVGATITLGSALPTITSELTLDGAGRTINANANGSVLSADGATVELTDLTLTGGSAQYGGGIRAFNYSSVSLSNCSVSGNSATNSGGGIHARTSSVSLSNCTVSGNLASSDYGGGIYAYRYSYISVSNSTVSGNSAADFGGGLYAHRDSYISVSNSIVSGNSAGRSGGGVYARRNSGVTLSNSTVSGNSAAMFGGGIFAYGSSVNLANSTVSGNAVSGFDGGGIFATNSSRVRLTNSTVSGNSAANFGGGIYASLSSVSLTNSLIAGNVAPVAAEIDNFSGTFTTVNNLLGDSSHTNAEAFTNFMPNGTDITATGDGTKATALSSILNPLADNGGPTQTHALAPRSPALDAGDNTDCGTGKLIDTDQRGEAREDGACDIGAVEGFVDDSSFFVVPLKNGKVVIFSL